jgi:hypothetical protein
MHMLEGPRGNDREPRQPSATTLVAVVAFCGFVAVGFANASNMVLARAKADETPAFSLAFFRWSSNRSQAVMLTRRVLRQGQAFGSPVSRPPGRTLNRR